MRAAYPIKARVYDRSYNGEVSRIGFLVRGLTGGRLGERDFNEALTAAIAGWEVAL